MPERPRAVRKKVLHLIPSFHQGGSEWQAVQLINALGADGRYEVRLACLEKAGVLLDRLNGFAVGDIGEFRLNSFHDMNMVRQLTRFAQCLRNERIDILQTHDFYSNIFGMFAARFARTPARIAAKRETGMRTSRQLFIERRAFAAADAIIANSVGVKEFLVSTGVKGEKIEVVHNGLDESRFVASGSDRASVLEELGITAAPSNRLVTIVANLRDEVKDHEMFIRAAARVAGRNDNARFVVAGEGERLKIVEQLSVDLGIESRLIFVGRCGRVPDLLSVSDVCVLTSRSEGFSNSIVEYMAAGKPVVATDVGGASEAVVHGETGFLVGSGDDESLADRLSTLLDDAGLAEKMGRLGKDRVAKMFTVRTQVERTVALYERLIESGTRRKAGK